MFLLSKRTFLLSLFLVWTLGTLVACGTFYPLPEVDKTDRDSVVASNTDFAFALHQKLSEKEKGNLFYSPYSISSALAMTYAGAKGDTAKEIADAFRWKLEGDKLHAAQSWLMLDLLNRGQKGNYELNIANRLWGEKTEPFLKDFQEQLKLRYLAGFETLDFAAQPEPSRLAINAWVKEQTRGKIENLLPPGSISNATKLVLTNAIYFKGNWDQQFKKSDTKNGDFIVSSSRKVTVPMMKQTLKENRYGKFGLSDDGSDKDGSVEILELPYKSKELAMVILLPSTDAMNRLEGKLSSSQLRSWLDKVDVPNKQIRLSMPRFKMTQSFKLSEALKSLGMKKAFTTAADFSGMNGQQGIFIASVHHKAFVEVNEEGTEAAAATAVTGVTSVPATMDYVVNRPFLFLLRDQTTGNILFVGRINDPTVEATNN
jgi:serpin B